MLNTFSSAKIKLCIFDLDGTLVNTISDLASSADFAMQSLGLPKHTINEYMNFVGNGTYKLISRSMPLDNQDEELTEQAYDIFTEHYSNHYCDTSYVYEGITEALQMLKSKKVKLVVYTNKPQKFAEGMISKLFGDELFDAVYGSRPPCPNKPNPFVEEYIIGSLNIKKNRCIHIGDSDVDVITAHNAGIKCIGCTWGFRNREHLEASGADYIIDSPDEIFEIFSEKQLKSSKICAIFNKIFKHDD